MRVLLSLAVLLISTTLASAHPGIGPTGGFVHGFAHPLSGLDHILTMVAVGIFAANLGGRAIWAVPLTFMSFMAAGCVLGFSGLPLPYVEVGIALSVIALGLAVAIRWNWSLAAAMTLVGAFAVFHGHAHGTEMLAGAAGMTFAAGFVVATGVLHACGIALGTTVAALARDTAQGHRMMQAGGLAMSALGVGILFGVL